jgi:hypothetical protein
MFSRIAVAIALSACCLCALEAQGEERDFPQASVDYFAAMDDGVRLTPDEVRGRNTWLIWTADNDAFWDHLARRSFGNFDLLKVLDSRNREKRFSYYGLMNEPGFKQATAPDKYGLWLDIPAGTRDGAFAVGYRENLPKDDFLRIYGRASGIVGLRLFPNPDFDDAAEARWLAAIRENPDAYYSDRKFYADETLVRPYRVGMACGFCHVGPHPLHPPSDPEAPQWQNLSSLVGSQYLRPERVFVLPGSEDNFLFHVVKAMPPGTVDTSALATDNINNPRSMNAIYQVGARLATAAGETLAGGNLDMPGTKSDMPVPHALKDGADSIGILGALARVYISIGTFHSEWVKHFNLLVGGKRQSPMPIALARENSPYFRATLDRLPNLAAFLAAAGRPHPLAQAPGGKRYLQDSQRTVARGQQIFAENCAACHVSTNKMPEPPAGVERYSPRWDEWTRSDDFKTRMAAAVRAPDFLRDNYLSTDRPYPNSRIGTNVCASVATNAMRGHVWDNFSSETYKQRPPAGATGIPDPFTGQLQPYSFPGGGRGYQRAPSLVSIWASAPYLHNNALGNFTGDPSVEGRMKAFEDGMEKLLWPEKRLGMASIARTAQTSWLTMEKSYLPAPVFVMLKAMGLGMSGADDVIRLGPIPKGTPTNLIANIDLEPTLDPARLIELAGTMIKLHRALRDIRDQNLDDDAAAARLKGLGPDLLKLSKCPDLVTDRGHLFGTGLAENDKRALIAYLKRL